MLRLGLPSGGVSADAWRLGVLNVNENWEKLLQPCVKKDLTVDNKYFMK